MVDDGNCTITGTFCWFWVHVIIIETTFFFKIFGQTHDSIWSLNPCKLHCPVSWLAVWNHRLGRLLSRKTAELLRNKARARKLPRTARQSMVEKLWLRRDMKSRAATQDWGLQHQNKVHVHCSLPVDITSSDRSFNGPSMTDKIVCPKNLTQPKTWKLSYLCLIKTNMDTESKKALKLRRLNEDNNNLFNLWADFLWGLITETVYGTFKNCPADL